MESKMIRQGGAIQTSVLVSTEFYKLCKENNIKFSEALATGIAILLAERGIREYDNQLNIYRKMRLYQTQLEETSQKILEMENKNIKRSKQ